MSIGRKLRKRFTKHPARADDIIEAFKMILGRAPTVVEINRFEKKYLTRRALDKRLSKFALNGLIRGEGSAATFPPHIAQLNDEEFVEQVCLGIGGRFPSPMELQSTAYRLRTGEVDRASLMVALFSTVAREQIAQQKPHDTVWKKIKQSANSPEFSVMGTPVSMTVRDWWNLARSSKEASRKTTHAQFPLQPRHSEVDVSIICSLWRGGEFIERYMENITSQSIFADRCELIIVDAASPEGEAQVIERYKVRFGDRIVYHRMPHRAGIYSAWNYGIGIARGRYLTNANLDDLRRHDSLERQASALDALSFVDVVYDDHLYFCDPKADFDLIERVGVASELPLVTRSNMFTMNGPHNGPMWRAQLHHRIGQFDESYRSAGDYDFWIRALIDGSTFYKLNEPTVGYYFNPEGLSTAATGVGALEARQALKKHGRQLIPEAARESYDDFRMRLGMSKWPDEAGAPITRYALVQKKMREVAGRHGPQWSGR